MSNTPAGRKPIVSCCRSVADVSDALLASSNVNSVLNLAIRRGRYAEVADVLSRMSTSESEPARQTAVRQLTVASYLDRTLDPAVDDAFAGDETSRAAITGVYASNIVHLERRDRAIAGDAMHAVRIALRLHAQAGTSARGSRGSWLKCRGGSSTPRSGERSLIGTDR